MKYSGHITINTQDTKHEADFSDLTIDELLSEVRDHYPNVMSVVIVISL